MKHILLITSFMFFLSIQAQEVEKTEKAKHSFYLSAGIFGQTGNRDYAGISSSLGYQIRFPNRFILGLEFLTDQSFFKKMHSTNPNYVHWRRVNGLSGRVQ